jgi:hypothetical protein
MSDAGLTHGGRATLRSGFDGAAPTVFSWGAVSRPELPRDIRRAAGGDRSRNRAAGTRAVGEPLQNLCCAILHPLVVIAGPHLHPKPEPAFLYSPAQPRNRFSSLLARMALSPARLTRPCRKAGSCCSSRHFIAIMCGLNIAPCSGLLPCGLAWVDRSFLRRPLRLRLQTKQPVPAASPQGVLVNPLLTAAAEHE